MKKRGFTLIELILVLSIIMGLMVGIFYIYTNVKESLAAKSIADQMISLKNQYDSLAGSAGVAGEDKLDNYLNSNCDIYEQGDGGIDSLNIKDYSKKCFKDLGFSVDQSSSTNDGTFIGFAGQIPAVFGVKSASLCMKIVSDLYSIIPKGRINGEDSGITLFYDAEATTIINEPLEGNSVAQSANSCVYFNNAKSDYYISLDY